MMKDITPLLNELDIAARRRSVGREMFAAVCIVRPCFKGVKFTLAPAKKLAARVGQPNVYEIEGVEGFYIGLEAAVDKVVDLGVTATRVGIRSAITNHKPIGGYTVVSVGRYSMEERRIVRFDEAA